MGPELSSIPAAFSFTSIAILDALKMFSGPIIELHISNIHRREAYYHHSLVSKIATGILIGLGPSWLFDSGKIDAGFVSIQARESWN